VRPLHSRLQEAARLRRHGEAAQVRAVHYGEADMPVQGQNPLPMVCDVVGANGRGGRGGGERGGGAGAQASSNRLSRYVLSVFIHLVFRELTVRTLFRESRRTPCGCIDKPPRASPSPGHPALWRCSGRAVVDRTDRRARERGRQTSVGPQSVRGRDQQTIGWSPRSFCVEVLLRLLLLCK
jgi:hypothetical protein